MADAHVNKTVLMGHRHIRAAAIVAAASLDIDEGGFNELCEQFLDEEPVRLGQAAEAATKLWQILRTM